jgi:hypothetical protein
MKCRRHPHEHVLGLCRRCERFVCARDSLTVRDWLYCKSCAGRSPGPRKRGRGRRWRAFSKARAFARALGLRTSEEYRKWAHGRSPESRPRPVDIPAYPPTAYPDQWRGWDDWLGRSARWRPFEAARAFARGLQLRIRDDWVAYAKGPRRPRDVPACPQNVYVKEWKGWGDWLGTGRVANFLRVWRPFREARAYAHGLGLRGEHEWRVFVKSARRPQDIPANPNNAYRGQWKSWGDWLGTGNVANYFKTFRPFAEARAFVWSLRLSGQAEWAEFASGRLLEKGTRPPDVPAAPWNTYKSQWRNLGDWLGTGTVAPAQRRYRPFPAARAFARRLKLTSVHEWEEFTRGELPEKGTLPADIPATPRHVYSGQFLSMGDWLGTGRVATFLLPVRPFRKARAFARSLGLHAVREWLDYCRGKIPDMPPLPEDIRACPEKVYRTHGWRGYADWLGVPPRRVPFRPFREARAYARSLGLASPYFWQEHCAARKPRDVPRHPDRVYSRDWAGWEDWLGKCLPVRGVTAPRSSSCRRRPRSRRRSSGTRSDRTRGRVSRT